MNQPGENKQLLTHGQKVMLKSTVTIIGLIALFFAGLFVYYTWQLKYGDPNDLAKLEQEISSNNFTVADNSRQKAATVDIDINTRVRPHNPIFGNPNAKTTVLLFIDFECPFCQASHPITKSVMERYSSAVKFVFKHMPLASIHRQALSAAHAAQCAHEQGRFWEYYEQLFTSKQFTDEALVTQATNLGMNSEQFTTCLFSEKFANEIQTDALDGLDLGVRGTPTYYVNQHVIEGVANQNVWNQHVLRTLQ